MNKRQSPQKDLMINPLVDYAQHINEDGYAPMTIAILAEDYGRYIKELHGLWQQQQRPWHIILVERHYQQHAWKCLEKWFPHALSHKVLPIKGMHRIDIEPYRFTVTMLFDESPQAWSKFSAQVHIFVVDSADTKDYQQACRMSVAKPLICSATELDVAWRALVQDQQLTIEKQITCSLLNTSTHKPMTLYFLTSQRPEMPIAARLGRQITIIGAGVAGAGVAFALAHRGWRVKVLDPMFTQGPDEQAYRYASGAVTPLLTADDCHKARLSRAGVLRAHARWTSIAKQAGIQYCGTLELNRDKGHAKDLLDVVVQSNFPSEWVRLVSAEEATTLAGVDINQEGAFFPLAMQIPPVRLAWTLLQHANIECLPVRVEQIQVEEDHTFTLQTNQGVMSAAVLLVATAMHSRQLLEQSNLSYRTLKSGQVVNALKRLESLHALAGEVMMVPANQLNGGPQCVIGGQGYYLPAQEGFCVMGSTYEHGNLAPEVTKVGQQTIWQKIPLDLPVSLSYLQQQQCLKGRACVRAVLQGRLPIIAELPHHKHLWVATAYASHGMTWSSLAGDIIGASLEGEPLPIEKDLLAALSFKV